MFIVISEILIMCWQKYMIMKNGRYQINMDVLLFPWKLTYKNRGSGLIPKGSFGKVHLAQDAVSRKRMACKLVSPTAKAGILSVPRGFQFRLRAKVITIHLTGSVYSHIYTFEQYVLMKVMSNQHW